MLESVADLATWRHLCGADPVVSGKRDLIEFEIRDRRPIALDAAADEGVRRRRQGDEILEWLAFGPGDNIELGGQQRFKLGGPCRGHASAQEKR